MYVGKTRKCFGERWLGGRREAAGLGRPGGASGDQYLPKPRRRRKSPKRFSEKKYDFARYGLHFLKMVFVGSDP